MEIIINNLNETKDFAERFAKCLKGSEVVILEGELASGKTTFTSYLAKSLGVREVVNSPSFTLYKRYESGKYILNHMDLYRMNNIGSDFDLIDYYFDGVTVIEWASNIPDLIPEQHLEIKFIKLGETKRKLVLIPKGKYYEKLLKCIH